jgi:DNA-binding CsgD family transcriptional regulator
MQDAWPRSQTGQFASTAREESAWLAQVQLLAELPYPAPTLVPYILAAVRSGIDADFGAFGWVDGAHLRPVAFWSERMTEGVFRAFSAHLDVFFDECPLRAQLESDGEDVRAFQDVPGYESHWHLTEILAPLGARWATGVPIKDRDGACTGFLYLYRRSAAGRYTDAEQVRLRRARDQMRGLSALPVATAKSCALRPADTATLHFDNTGRLLARGIRAIELLYLCHEVRMGVMDWAGHDISVMPAEAREMLRAHFGTDNSGDVTRCTLHNSAGRFDFRAERLRRLDGSEAHTAVTIHYWEPIDITVARQLARWPLSAQEKRLIVASARQLGHKEIADSLGITVGTLKAYVNKLKAKLGVDSRQDIIERLLAEAGAS